jgi:hypothetical protein
MPTPNATSAFAAVARTGTIKPSALTGPGDRPSARRASRTCAIELSVAPKRDLNAPRFKNLWYSAEEGS